jgi:Leucine Rich repeat
MEQEGGGGGQQQQQQQPQASVVIHRAVLNGIAHCLENRRRLCDQRHKLHVVGVKKHARVVARRSLEFLVDFMDNGSGSSSQQHDVTSLELGTIRLSSSSNNSSSNPLPAGAGAADDDGGLEVLRSLFARSDTSLTRVRLFDCDFGTAQEALHLVSAFESNRTISDLTFSGIVNLEGTAALGNALCGLLQQQNASLQRLKYRGSMLDAGIVALQPGLSTNQTLKELSLPFCGIGNEGMRLLTDALVGSTTLLVLDIRNNRITSIVDITRLIDSTRLETIDAGGNRGILNDETRIVAPGLRLRPYLKELFLPFCGIEDEGLRRLADGLVGNMTMHVLDLRNNDITSAGLVDVMRLIDSTWLHKIGFLGSDYNVFDNRRSTREFVATLERSSTVQELLGIAEVRDLRGHLTVARYSKVIKIMDRNKSLNHVDLLLTTPPPPPSNGSTTTLMWMKTCHKAIAKFATLPNDAGANAMFKLFQARGPALLANRLKLPPPVAAAAAAARQPRSPKRRYRAPATEGQASKKTHRAGDGGANAYTTTTTASPATDAATALFQETEQCIATASAIIKVLLEQGDHDRAALLVTQYQEANFNVTQALLHAGLQRLEERYGD